ncbi:MBL fold metallo-hydrolase [Halosquirtibacter laminarini]|uniref:MBL fold metallo-hydrolase n=1 Tax=Halosquirtibacter laminarini TaxID=3374600 RepID=A0AC61NQT1_9BACT|nr:MBL fold metallo-hydrolase [Prolixibacteraceae bacterium]
MKQSAIKKHPIEVTLYRNATMRIKHFGIHILTDPMLSDKATFMSFVTPEQNLNPTVDLPMPLDRIIEGIDMVLISHLHPDHFDAKAMEVLPKTLPIVCSKDDSNAIKEMGFIEVIGIEDSTTWRGIRFTKTGGKHGVDELKDQLGEVVGFVLEAPGYETLYWVGDCILDNQIRKNIHKYNPKIIITHSGGAIYLGEHQILMNGDDTIEIAKQVPDAKIIAVHLDALDHCLESRTTLKTKVKEQEVKNIYIPLDGQKLTL